MTDGEVTVDDVAARTTEQGRVSVTGAGTAALEVLVPAGVGVPGADEEEFAAALVAVLLRRGATVPTVLDASAAIATDPGLLAEVTQRLETLWADQD